MLVHKGGDKADPVNFCPSSVVPIAAKVLERLITNQLSSYLDNHRLLHDHQEMCANCSLRYP